LGGEFKELGLAPSLPTVVLMAGLQGAGKTTTAGKLAKRFKDKGKSCLLVPADVYRPAAIEQLNLIGQDLDVEVYQAEGEINPVKICQNAVELHGGMGAMLDVGIEKLYRDATIFLHMDATVDISHFKIIKAMFPETAGAYAGPEA